MRETNRHPLQKCTRSNVIITSKSLGVSLCANSRQAGGPWALARPGAHISGDVSVRNGVSSSGRLITRCFRYTLIKGFARRFHYTRIQSSQLKHRLHCSPTRRHIRKTSIKCWVPNNRRVSNKRLGFEANVPINVGSRLKEGSQINTRVF